MDIEPTSSDLEQFRQQWQQEVSARNQQQQRKPNTSGHAQPNPSIDQLPRPERRIARPPGRHPLADKHEGQAVDQELSTPLALNEKIDHLKLGDADDDEFAQTGRAEPQTALEHYERAVEQEGQGQLGDSLSHYRKAFKLDENIFQTYREKYFAHKWRATKPDVSTAVPVVASTTHHSQPEAVDELKPQTTAQLVASYADCEIQNVPPIIEGGSPPACPIGTLPTEVLLELLQHIAQIDVSIFARLASVCKKLAYHVYLEKSIWKQIALGPNFGLGSQQYHFSTDIQGRPAIWQALGDDDEGERPTPSVTESSFTQNQDWREVFHSYPRVRFSGVYISTVNYTRSGGVSVTPSTWGSQVHIVTYYRYLRFFRDGTVISLLTTHTPRDVVNILTKENLDLVRSDKGRSKEPINPAHFSGAGNSLSAHPNAPPPSAQNILKQALRGRWRLCHPSLDSTEIGSNAAVPGDLHIETEGGAGPRYLYTMHLGLKHVKPRDPSATRNNKLVWKGFWSYNTISADWAEFHLKHDKAFFFSRVKSYGLGY